MLGAQSCPTLWNTMTYSLQAPLSMEFSSQEYWSGLLFPSPGDLRNLGVEPGSPSLQADSLLSEPPGKCIMGEAIIHCTSEFPRGGKDRILDA